MTISESIVLKTRDDMPKWLFGNVLRTLYLKGFRGFGSTCKQSETLPQDELVEDKCTSGFGSTCELTETLAKDIEVVEDTSNQGVYYSDGLVSVDAQQNLIQVTVYSASDLSLDVEQDEKVTAYSASDLSLDVEQDEKVDDGSLRRRIDEQEQKAGDIPLISPEPITCEPEISSVNINSTTVEELKRILFIDPEHTNEVSKNHDRLKPEILYVPYRNNAAKPFISVIFICMLCVLPGTIAFKAHLGYNQFDNVLGKPGRSPLPNESIIVPDANNFQAHSKPQPAQQNANEEVNKARIGHGLFGQAKVGGKNGDYKKQTEESRKIREVEEAITNKKGEPQQEVKTERKMVALTPSLRDITRDKYEIFEHIVTRKGTLSIKIRHYPDEKVCSLTIITNMTTTEYTSKEEQDGNIIVERRDTFCIFHFKNFTLESYVNTTVYADADLRRILHPDLFLNRLNDRIAVYQTNDQEGTVRISTVGENVQCSIQPTSVVEKISEERGHMVTTLFIKYKKAGVCFYNISCNMSGFIHSIIHQVENCIAEPTVTTQLPSDSGITDHSTSNNTTTTSSKRDGISGRPNIAAIICPVVFGVFVIVTVLYFIKKKTINHWLRITIDHWHMIIIEHCCMLCRSTITNDNDTPEDRSGDYTQKPLRKPESNDSGIELAGQSTSFLPDNQCSTSYV